MTMPVMQWVESCEGELPEMPIEPGWILEGEPEARGKICLQTADKLVSTGLWSCTPGKFRWEFAGDEIVYLLAGEVLVSDSAGNTMTLRPGDIAEFPRGTTAVWDVRKAVRKVFTLRTQEPLE